MFTGSDNLLAVRMERGLLYVLRKILAVMHAKEKNQHYELFIMLNQD
jgi:hypothetical protein